MASGLCRRLMGAVHDNPAGSISNRTRLRTEKKGNTEADAIADVGVYFKKGGSRYQTCTNDVFRAFVFSKQWNPTSSLEEGKNATS